MVYLSVLWFKRKIRHNYCPSGPIRPPQKGGAYVDSVMDFSLEFRGEYFFFLRGGRCFLKEGNDGKFICVILCNGCNSFV